jgi:hypothetical protein
MPSYGHPQHFRCARAALALWIYHLFRVMLVRVPVHGMQGGWKSNIKKRYVLSFSRSPGGSAAKDAVEHAVTRHQKTINLKAARAEGDYLHGWQNRIKNKKAKGHAEAAKR